MGIVFILMFIIIGLLLIAGIVSYMLGAFAWWKSTSDVETTDGVDRGSETSADSSVSAPQRRFGPADANGGGRTRWPARRSGRQPANR